MNTSVRKTTETENVSVDAEKSSNAAWITQWQGVDPEVMLRQILPEARLTITALENIPAIRLRLIDPNGMDARLSAQEVDAVFAAPPYWSFCWGSGKALAAHMLQDMKDIVGATVLDFGCGSGVVAIAAALAGAKRVVACDCDSVALAAAAHNAELNKVDLDYILSIVELDERVDYLFAADVLYDPDNFPMLQQFRRIARQVIIADSRISDFRADGYAHLGRTWSVTQPNLGEPTHVGCVTFYRAHGESGNV